jgi:HAD superfamily 5'-nucleotidase-like hydrolase
MARQIFVNRTLRMESIRTIGFDLDWTLADYRRQPLEELPFQLTVERLIQHHGYPESIRQAELRPNFPRRGLLIDKEAGTVLRMNRHRYVNLAYHGRERLDRRELKRLYRYEPIQPSSQRFYHLDSLFELPEANLYAELIELATRSGRDALPSSWQIFDDVRAAIDWVHGHGSLKSSVMTDVGRYLQPDPELGLALLRLALGGRRLILLTNSEWNYADAICSFLFDGLLPGLSHWRELFDLVLVRSRKPDFFRSNQPFVELAADGAETASSALPAWGGIYESGSLAGLMQLIGEPGERVLYVGDHIYGDIVSSKLESTWRTALIVRELETEIARRQELDDEIRHGRQLKRTLTELGHDMDHLRDVLGLLQQQTDHEEGRGRAEREDVENRLRQIVARHRRILGEQARWSDRLERQFNPYWGSFFKQGVSKTRFSSQLETYSCLYTSRVSNFAYYGTNRYFRVTRDPMMHEWAVGQQA